MSGNVYTCEERYLCRQDIGAAADLDYFEENGGETGEMRYVHL